MAAGNHSVFTLRPVGYRGVTLGDSLWKRQFDQTMEMYLAIPDDSLLHPFRKQAGLPAPGRPLDGWYGKGMSTFGQKLSAFAKAWTGTGEGRFKEKALHLASEWFACADHAPQLLEHDTYVFDKLIGGLIDLHEHLDCDRALEFVGKLTDSAIRRFKHDIPRDGIQNEHLWGPHMIEWYTLPEQLLRAYRITRDAKYLDFAKEWDYAFYWQHALDGDFRIGARHAYSHINALSSGAQLYLATGEEKYLKAIIAIHDEVLAYHTFATGGYGPAESLFVDRDSWLGDSLKPAWDAGLQDPVYTAFDEKPKARDDRWGSCEVSCCAWAVFKICGYLLSITGEARFGDWAERMLVNGVGGQLPITQDGKVMYYAGYWLDGAVKTTEDRRMFDDGSNFHWQCCTGTFPQDVAEYCNLLVYLDDEGVSISQYLPFAADFSVGGRSVTLVNESNWPAKSRLRFTVRVSEDTEFRLRLRVPSWLTEAAIVKVNGVRQDIACMPNKWAEIRRVWKNGDVVSADFPHTLRFSSVDAHSPEVMALHYGPMVLVADETALFHGDVAHPETWILPERQEGAEGPDGRVKSLAFRTEPGHVGGYDFLTRCFVPYHEVGEMQWYHMYNRVTQECDATVPAGG